jgi:ADP-ribose pyrophosphatase
MDDGLARYFELAERRPALFVNPPDAGLAILLSIDDIRAAEDQIAARLEARGLPRGWARVGIAYEDQYLLLLRDAVRFPDGSLGTYIRTIPPEDATPGVVILPRLGDEILTIRHFRHATRAWHVEVPRGFGAPGSSSEENARRELAEEIGASAVRLVYLGYVHPDAGGGAGRVDLYFADVDAVGEVEQSEAISAVVPMKLSEFEEKIRSNEITDGFTLMAYALAKAQGVL